MSVFAFLCICIACSNNEDLGPVDNNQNAAVDPTRKVFVNEEAVINFLKSVQEEDSLPTEGNDKLQELSILEKFAKFTSFGGVLNDKAVQMAPSFNIITISNHLMLYHDRMEKLSSH